MPKIVPIRDLKDTNKIYEKAKSVNEPIFVTKNGYGALVLMSMETYERNYAQTEVRRMLQEAEDEIASGVELLDSKEVFARMREKYGI
jgi:PHD/YefM family antitoxin component YafN of YafNO toxin-antitoxin module